MMVQGSRSWRGKLRTTSRQNPHLKILRERLDLLRSPPPTLYPHILIKYHLLILYSSPSTQDSLDPGFCVQGEFHHSRCAHLILMFGSAKSPFRHPKICTLILLFITVMPSILWPSDILSLAPHENRQAFFSFSQRLYEPDSQAVSHLSMKHLANMLLTVESLPISSLSLSRCQISLHSSILANALPKVSMPTLPSSASSQAVVRSPLATSRSSMTRMFNLPSRADTPPPTRHT